MTHEVQHRDQRGAAAEVVPLAARLAREYGEMVAYMRQRHDRVDDADAALREGFREEWQPRGGLEDALLDTLAQCQSAYLFWLGRLQVLTTTEASRQTHQRNQERAWAPPRVTEAEAVEQAAAMVERFNRLFLRTARTLRELRRATPVIVQGAGQVNVAERQVNLAPKPSTLRSHASVAESERTGA
jgi:hypothetical protein